MSKMQKSQLAVDGNHFNLSMPFAKVDKEKRLVSGFATLDNVDTQGDIVEASASAKAFARARGNIREMHQPLAVGRMVEFREDEFYDDDSKEFYRGIFVTAHVSKGAQDTWEKVLDGTLTGFSIGGEVKEASNEINKTGEQVRLIKDYDLVELSLVDNPANQFANVVSFQKSDTGSVTAMTGFAVETEIKNVFICPTDDTVSIKNEESDVCPTCGQKMETAGWFEEGPDRAEKVGEIVTKFLNPLAKEAAPISHEGGVEMEPETVETGVEKPDPDEDKTAPEPEAEEAAVEVVEIEGTEETEVAEAPEEVADEETEISKKIDALHAAIEDTLANTKGEFSEEVAALKKFVAEQLEPIVTRTSELEEKIDGFSEKLSVAKGRLDNYEHMLEKMNSADALRKSGDLDEEDPGTNVQKNSFWSQGAFSGKSDKGFSVIDSM